MAVLLSVSLWGRVETQTPNHLILIFSQFASLILLTSPLLSLFPGPLFVPRATLLWWSSSLESIPLVHFPYSLIIYFLLFLFFIFLMILFLIVVSPFPFTSSWFSLIPHLASSLLLTFLFVCFITPWST